MGRRNHRFRMEHLETRELMAGDIAATWANGDLHLNEAFGQAGLDNGVLISQLSENVVRVAGNGTPSGTSTVNGRAYQDYFVPGSLYINFGGGDDRVVFDGIATPTFNQVHINVAAPPPVASPNFASSLITGPVATDNDQVIVWSVSTRGSMTVKSGAGHDWVFVADATIGQVYGANADLSIYAGAGADTVQVKSSPFASTQIQGNLFVQLYDSLNENDADVASLNKATAYGDLFLLAGGGDDRLYLNQVGGRRIYADAGSGNDRMELLTVSAREDMWAELGSGNDFLKTSSLTALNLHLIGGSDYDELRTEGTDFIYSRTQSGWELINGVRQDLWTVVNPTLKKSVAVRR